MSLSQFLSIFRARWVLVLSVLLGVVTLVVLVSLILPSKYTATSQVVIDSKSPDPINGAVLQNGMLPSYLATQIDVIQSDRVAQKVIRKLRLNESPEMRSQWQDATDGEGVFESWLAKLLLKNLEVLPSRESSVIEVEYTAIDPRFAAVVTNAFVQSYLETTLELRVEPAKRFSALFDEQVKSARDRLEEAQNKLSSYQQAKGILVTDERLDVESARLAELSSQLVSLQAMSAESRSRKKQAGANVAEVLNNPVVSGLKADLARLEARLKEMSAKYGDAYPQVAELQANIDELRSRMNAEISRVTSSMSINNTVNQSRESDVRAALEAQREKLMKMKEERDGVAVLLRDVENAQRSYDTLQARYAQSSLESQSNQTDVSILQVATPPSERSSPQMILNLIIGIVLGLFLGLNAAIVKEMMDRRLRSEEDVIQLLGSPLAGIMPKALEAKRGGLLPVVGGAGPRLPRRAIPELSSPA